jgi:hypothetical protein
MKSDVRILAVRTGYLWAIHIVEVEDDRCPLIEG